MAGDGGLLGGYKVGLISAALNCKGKEKGKNNEDNIDTLLFPTGIAQPSFIPVTKKKPKKKQKDLTEKNEDEDHELIERRLDKEEEKGTKRKSSMKDESVLLTKKQKRLPVKKSSEDDPERLARTLFVGNLPISTSRKDLKKLFKKYGEIESTRLRSVAVQDLKTTKKVATIKKLFNPNRNNINGYVVFKIKESVEKALESNGEVIGDFHIRVDRVGNRGKQYDHKRSIFVGNLIFDIKEEDFSELFAVCGEVQGVRIVRDSATGIGKGFGYVLFKEASSVSLALKMNNSELCGRNIRVQPSQEKPKDAKGGAIKNSSLKNFSGMQAKQRFYHKRKAMKQQKNIGVSSKKNGLYRLSSTKKQPSKFNKQSSTFNKQPSKFNKQPSRFNKQPSKFNKHSKRTNFKQSKK